MSIRLPEGFRLIPDQWETPQAQESLLEESQEIEDPYIETKEWKPISPKTGGNLRVAFVDGVLRFEQGVYLEGSGGKTFRGTFLSIGAGAIITEPGRVNTLADSLAKAVVRRYLILHGAPQGVEGTFSFELGNFSITFNLLNTRDDTSSTAINLMRREELKVALEVMRERKPDLIIADGNLHYTPEGETPPLIGLVKTHRKNYIPEKENRVLRELNIFERTPIVKLHPKGKEQGKETRRLDKFTWYVRIGKQEGFSGLVRLEVRAGVGLKTAVELADKTASTLPLFASDPIRDMRSPQNLLPVGFLEKILRKLMGDHLLIKRAIATQLFKRLQSL